MLWRALLLVGLILLGSQVSSSRFVDINKNEEVFAISVEHVLYQFNESQEDEFAYKFMRIRRSKRKVSGPSVAPCSSHTPPGAQAGWWCPLSAGLDVAQEISSGGSQGPVLMGLTCLSKSRGGAVSRTCECISGR
uniref:Cystatin domain-containing protein n=1 Tax=Oryctolagus cuniculus TaxID=9986 RepID=A0A5F9DTY5_RABIT